jgi:ATP-binding cassette subfamily F protein uup
LERFNGAVIAVSHDRYFLDKVVDTIFEFHEDGTIRTCLGDYSHYLKGISSKQVPLREKAVLDKKASRTRQKNEPKLKLSFSEQHEFKTIEAEIAKDEKRLSEISNRIQGETSDYIKLSELTAKKEVIEKDLDNKMERWVYLNDLVEKIGESKSS